MMAMDHAACTNSIGWRPESFALFGNAVTLPILLDAGEVLAKGVGSDDEDPEHVAGDELAEPADLLAS